MEEKYRDSPRKIDIQALCSDNRFGEINFLAVIKPLEKMISDIIELEDLDYKNNLPQSDINQIDSVKNQLNRFINQIQGFSLSQPNPSQVRDNIQLQINRLYETSFIQNTRTPLMYLKQQIKLDKRTEKELQTAIANAKKIEKELQERLSKIKQDEESIVMKKGIISSRYLSQKFQEAADSSLRKAQYWEKWVFWLSIGMTTIIIVLFLIYMKWPTWLLGADTSNTVKIEYGLFSVTLIASIFFFLRIVLRNYNILNHTTSANEHRTNVAATIEGFLENAQDDKELKDALLKEGTNAMFSPGSTGFLDKEQMEVSTPVKEVVTTVMKNYGN